MAINLSNYFRISEVSGDPSEIAIVLGMYVHTNEMQTRDKLGDSILDLNNNNRRKDSISKIEYVESPEIATSYTKVEYGILSMINDFLSYKRYSEIEEKCLAMLMYKEHLHGIMCTVNFSPKVKEIIDDVYDILFESRGNCVDTFVDYLESVGLLLHAQYAKLYSKEMFLENKPEQLWVRAMKNAWNKGELSEVDPTVVAAYKKYLDIRIEYRNSSINVELNSLYDIFNVKGSTYRENRSSVLRKLISFYKDSIYSDYISYLVNS